MKKFTENKRKEQNIYFSSDWHLNEKRIFDFNPFFRHFKSIKEQNNTIISNMNKIIKQGDILYLLGDVSMDLDGIKLLEKLNVKEKYLIIGNYDEDKIEYLRPYFNNIYNDKMLNINGYEFNLNHYPVNAKKDMFNIVGHIHSLWKVQKNMVNVGVDAWNFHPVSLKEILFIKNAIDNHYDDNVFPKS